ncbi:signal peptidase II [Micrococcaceae bacterium RIT802]|nr:signal peptidase II [Micrococcaceae bacterium RIT 802]
MDQDPAARPDDAGTEAPPPGRGRPALIAVALVIAVLGIGLDQATKALVQSTMELGEKIDVLGSVLSWHYILNPGAAFSMGTSVTWIFTIVMAVVVVYVLTLLRKVRSRLWAVALGGLLAGATGNLIDRLFREPSFGMGHVVDFIGVRNFAIFNVADSFVVCSMIGICLLLFRGIGVDGLPMEDKPARKGREAGTP